MAQFHFQRAPMPLPLQGLRQHARAGRAQRDPGAAVPDGAAGVGQADDAVWRRGQQQPAGGQRGQRRQQRGDGTGQGQEEAAPGRAGQGHQDACPAAGASVTRPLTSPAAGGHGDWRRAPVPRRPPSGPSRGWRRRASSSAPTTAPDARSGPARVICLRPAPASIARPTGPRGQAGGQLLGGGHGAGGGGARRRSRSAWAVRSATCAAWARSFGSSSRY